MRGASRVRAMAPTYPPGTRLPAAVFANGVVRPKITAYSMGMHSAVPLDGPTPASRRSTLLAGALLLVVVAAVLTWSKWWPYAHKIGDLVVTRDPGDAIFPVEGSPVARAWGFTLGYAASVWKAMLAALVIAAAADALLPRLWPAVRRRAARAGRRPWRDATLGSLSGSATMMCTCCAVPVTATLRRQGASEAATLAYWLANPMLNPAVIVFCALLLPWEWAAVRLVAGVGLIAAVTALVARRAAAPAPLAAPDEPWSPAWAVRRFGRTLSRLALVVVPEYVVIVFAVGLAQTWLVPSAGWGDWAVLAVVAAALAGTVLVIPTGGELPIVAGLLAAGASPAFAGALFLTLPALSAASLVMLRRVYPVRTLAQVTGLVIVSGLAGAGALALL
ncbi:MAG: permease [Streptosporangiales bacterium]|nr:permease [Streptosporangiales bacterium]